MKLKSLFLGAALIASAVGAQAGNMNVALNQTAGGFWSADYDSDFLVGPLLGGAPSVIGTDTITFQDFTMPLAPGLYNVEVTFHELAKLLPTVDPINVISSTLNGIPESYKSRRTFSIDGNTLPPFILTVTGATNIPDAGYHGTITVTAVPEPETYAMLLAGLGLMGTIARRRSAKKSSDAA
jgi:hypothetical protein